MGLKKEFLRKCEDLGIPLVGFAPVKEMREFPKGTSTQVFLVNTRGFPFKVDMLKNCNCYGDRTPSSTPYSENSTPPYII